MQSALANTKKEVGVKMDTFMQKMAHNCDMRALPARVKQRLHKPLLTRLHVIFLRVPQLSFNETQGRLLGKPRSNPSIQFTL